MLSHSSSTKCRAPRSHRTRKAPSRKVSHAQRQHIVSSKKRSFSAVPQATAPLVSTSLQNLDPQIYDIIMNERKRQRESLCLIPSENFTSRAVLDTMGSVMQNKYSEGYPGARYYGGNEFIDQAESLCQQRALTAFNATENWGVNVQPLSGSPANFEVFTALLPVHGRIMSLDLPHGGHLSHGYSLRGNPVSAVSKYFEILPYHVDSTSGLIDYDELERNIVVYRPKVLIMGTSAYSREIDYARMRRIADSVDATLMCDMSHISGLVAAGVVPSPFPYADIVTTTTHKTLRGPRGAMIFYRTGQKGTDKKGNPVMYDFEAKINKAVFPGHQGGPHNHTIAALAVALQQATTPEFKQYQQQVLDNAKALSNFFTTNGLKVVTGGTDNHLLLIDVASSRGVLGDVVEALCENVNISLNKNTIPGDSSALKPSGIRIGSPAMTTRGLGNDDFVAVGQLLLEAIDLAAELDKERQASGPKPPKMAQWLQTCTSPKIAALKQKVVQFSSSFPSVPDTFA